MEKKVSAKSIILIWENSVIAFQCLIANRLRAILTILGIAIGTATIIMILTIIEGLDATFMKQISILGTDNLHISKFPWGAGLDMYKYRNRKDITVYDARAIQERSTLIKSATSVISRTGTITYKKNNLNNAEINGTDQHYSGVFNVVPESGRFLNAYEVDHRQNNCVIGSEVAEKLFEYDIPLDKKIYIDNYPFKVIGVLEERGRSFGGSLDSQVFIPMGCYRKIYGTRRSIMISVKVNSTKQLEETEDELRGILRRSRKVKPGGEDNFSINRQDDLLNLYNNLTNGLFAVAIGIGFITMLVGGIGIMNIMLVAVKERTHEIGIRKAIGAKKKDLIWQFLVESVLISSLGGVLGIVVGIASAKLIASISTLPAEISPEIFITGISFSCAVGIFFGLFPAIKAAELNAVEGLRYE